MSGRCDRCGVAGAGIYELALMRVDDGLMDPDAVACARMVELCPDCRDTLAARVAQLVPVWEADGPANRHDAGTEDVRCVNAEKRLGQVLSMSRKPLEKPTGVAADGPGTVPDGKSRSI